MPEFPDPTAWQFPSPEQLDPDDDLVAIGADLAPATLLSAYASGIFPMPGDHSGDPVYWFSPVHRGVLVLEDLVVSRSLRRSRRDFEIRINTAFSEVLAGCADPSRPQGWIDRDITRAYTELHRMGWAHSVETWRDGELVGGLYGVAIGGLFAGESMFHRVKDASKVALIGLVEALSADGDSPRRLLDVQWSTEHLASLGVSEIGRADYLARLAEALTLPLPTSFRS